jgi:hypothetical protein
LWREADPKRLQDVLAAMIKANVAWVPTLDIYEASRDLQRAQNQPWFREYLHPTLEEYFRPNPRNHGSYFLGWTSNDEVFWKENYRIWMAALRDFERMGGMIGAGDDAGFIYQIYGFGLLRELELHEEAGFNPIKVIQHVTGNGYGRQNRRRPARFFRRPDCGQRKSAGKHESAVSHWCGSDQRRQASPHRSGRMDHQGRLLLSRTHISCGSPSDGGLGKSIAQSGYTA